MYLENEARIHNATLAKKDSDLFYKTFMPLLSFTDKKFEILKNEGVTVGDTLVIEDYHRSLLSISSILWKNPSLLDEYIDAKKETLPAEHTALIEDWKKFIYGRFAVVHHQKNGSVFVDMETDKVYLVKGLTDPIPKLVSGFELPVVIVTTIIPTIIILVVNTTTNQPWLTRTCYISYNRSSDWITYHSLGHHARLKDSYPCFVIAFVFAGRANHLRARIAQ